MTSVTSSAPPAARAPLFPLGRIVQVSTLALAFLLPSLTWLDTAGAALLALLFNLFILPQLDVDRSTDFLAQDSTAAAAREHGGTAGLILYPVSVLLLILSYRRHLDIVAAAWALMALGDPAAALAGRTLGERRLPWNQRKTWAGSLAFVLAGGAGAYTLTRWLNPTLPADRTLLISALAALLGAAVESAPIGLDDNLTVPLVCGGFLYCAGLVERSAFDSNFPFLPRRLLLALAVNLAFALMALGLKAASRSGAALGFALGVLVYLAWGWKSFLVLFCFFLLGSAATRLGYARKAERGVAERSGGARSWREALANVAPGAFFAALAITTHHERAFLLAFVAAFAEAAGDTVSSEIGQWLSPHAYLITTLRRVAAGEDGALSAAGSAAGLAASALVAALAFVLGLASPGGAALAFGAAAAGNLFDSLLGATLERQGLLTNGAVNFAGTSLAGALALAVALR
ncbi:MAG TPA: DUF92 domain-containing protein [Terriglobia bacterium]|nr:DUF92 domain-containing protein [Terriglobia bacterium]